MLLNTPIKLGKPEPGAHVLDQLAAYLDYELPEPQRAAVREHLRGCPQCENELATLRAAKQLLRDLPTAVPPRSFKLNPDQVAALNPRPAAPTRRFGLPRLALALRLASAVCCLLLLPLLGTSALNMNSGSPAAMTTQSKAPLAAVAPTFLPEATTAAVAAATAPPAPAIAMAGSSAAPTATAALADVAGLLAAATATSVTAADAPTNPTFGSAADSQIAPAGPAATAAATQDNTALNGSRTTQGLAPGTESPDPLAKVPAPASNGYYYSASLGSNVEITTPTTGAATTQQLTPPPPAAESPSLLPWEIGLALAALAFALASIPVARQVR